MTISLTYNTLTDLSPQNHKPIRFFITLLYSGVGRICTKPNNDLREFEESTNNLGHIQCAFYLFLMSHLRL